MNSSTKNSTPNSSSTHTKNSAPRHPFNPHAHPIWHPCSQMKDYESFPPVTITKAEGSYLYTSAGPPLIDAISSWWCKPLGHAHPRLREAMIRQSEQFEHVILANITYERLEALSHALLTLSPTMSKIFYSGDGSSAIEIALKMSLQYHAQVSGAGKRTKFAYLTHAYHGENLLSLSVSDLGLYKNPFKSLCLENVCLPPHRLLTGRDDPYWDTQSPQNSSQKSPERDNRDNPHHSTSDEGEWEPIYQTLEAHRETLAGIIVEPIVQGAGGMKIHSPTLLRNLRTWSQECGVHLIADEVMTGLGRTGKAFAIEHSQITSDITVVMKGLSAGFLPFSAILTHADIYNAFYDDFETHKAFIHSNTYSGNALGAAVALEALTIYEEEQWFSRIAANEMTLRALLTRVAAKTGVLKNVRGIGWIAAADLRLKAPPSSTRPRPAYAVYQECVRLGLLLRPLGDTVYLLPPFNISPATLQTLEQILTEALLTTKHHYDLA